MRTQQEINKEWSDNSENYSAIIDDELNSFRAEAWRRKILEQVPSGKKLKILDTGCGPGFFTILLSLAGHEVIGIDGAEGMLLEAERKAATYGVHPEFRAMDCHHLEFPDNTFDLIISRNVTHALREHKTVYAQWLRVLKPEGILLIFDANWHLMKTDPAVHEEVSAARRRVFNVMVMPLIRKRRTKKNAERRIWRGSMFWERSSVLTGILVCWKDLVMSTFVRNVILLRSCGTKKSSYYMEIHRCL